MHIPFRKKFFHLGPSYARKKEKWIVNPWICWGNTFLSCVFYCDNLSSHPNNWSFWVEIRPGENSATSPACCASCCAIWAIYYRKLNLLEASQNMGILFGAFDNSDRGSRGQTFRMVEHEPAIICIYQIFFWEKNKPKQKRSSHFGLAG